MQIEVLGERYQIQDPIGRGGMATIYRGRDLRMDRIVAIKILREAYSTDPKFVTRFQREAKAASSLQHPNIVQVYDYGQSGGNYFIVMEYIDGTDLRRYIRSRGVLAVDRVIIIAHDVALGLGAAHRRQIVHRDVKPQNILVGRDGSIKLTDFGIASVYKDINDERLTTTGMTLGTVQYYAPEQAQGEIVHPAADVYALGIVMYEMLTGRTPFDGDTAVAVAMQHIQDLPTPPSQYNPAIHPTLEEIIMRCLEKIPEMRYRDGNALARALEMLDSGNPSRLRPPGGGNRSTAPSNPRHPPSHLGRTQFPLSGDHSERQSGFPGTSNQRSGMTPNHPPNHPPFPPNPALGGEYHTSNNDASATPEQETEMVPPREASSNALFENTPSDATVVIEPLQVGTYTPSSSDGTGETRPFYKNEMEQHRGAKESRQPIIVILLTLSAMLLLGFATFLGWTIVSTPPTPKTPTAIPSPQKVTVPKLIGMTYADAKARATSLHLKLQSEQNLTIGTVIRQSPMPPQQLEEGAVITVTMSNKPAGKVIPDLAGKSLAEAQDILKGLGIQSTQVVSDPNNPSDATKAANIVTRTDPPASQNLPPDQALILYVTNYNLNQPSPPPITQPTPNPTPTPGVTPTPTPTPTPIPTPTPTIPVTTPEPTPTPVPTISP